MAWTVTTPPAAEPMDIATARRHLRVVHTVEDDDISDWITAAREYIEDVCERAIMPQQWTERQQGFAREIELRGQTVRALVSVKFQDLAGEWQTLPLSACVLDMERGVALLRPAPRVVWPPAQRVEVLYELGYASAEKVPRRVISAMKLLVADFYVNRGASVLAVSRVDNPALERLLFPLKRVRP